MNRRLIIPVLAAALTQARDARLYILDVMTEAIDGPDEMSPYAPRITTIKVPIDKIGEVIGPKGKVINTITQETGADVSVSDDGAVGLVTIGSTNGEHVEEAVPKRSDRGGEAAGKLYVERNFKPEAKARRTRKSVSSCVSGVTAGIA